MKASLDKTLISKLKAGNEQAVKELYRNNFTICLNWAQRPFDVNKDEFEDAFQETVIAIYEASLDGKLDSLSCSLKTYLFAICRNKLLSQFKLEKRRSEQIAEIEIHQREWLSPEPEDQNRVEQVKDLIAKTDEPCKSILSMFYFNGFDIQTIAEKLKYANKEVVKVQKSRCLNYLKERVWKTLN